MAIAREHDLHRRRRSRNVGLGIVLILFVGLIFGLTVSKMQVLIDAQSPAEASQ